MTAVGASQARRDNGGYDALLPLEGTYRGLLQRHELAAVKVDWSYHDYLPIPHYAAAPKRRRLSEIAYTAVEIAALTEANLPWYTAYIVKRLPPEAESLLRFVEMWSAEEDQHSLLLESYLLVTDNGDHRRRAAMRKATVGSGFDMGHAGPFPVAVYTALQELQTRVFYLRAAHFVEAEDVDLARAFRRLAKDETLHANFYRDVVKAHLEADPDYVVAVLDVIEHFAMPGSNQPDYERRSALMSEAVLSLESFSRDVIEFACNYWQIDTLQPRTEAGRDALRRLMRRRRALARMARRGPSAAHAAPDEDLVAASAGASTGWSSAVD